MRTIRRWASCPALFAAILLVIASTTANVLFCYSLGATDIERWVFVGVGLAAEVIIGSYLVIAWRAYEQKRWPLVWATAPLFVLAASVSLMAALGFASQTRDHMVGTRQAAIDQARQTKAELARIEAAISALGTPRPVAAIESEIRGLLSDPRTENCAAINGRVTKEVCPKVFAAQTELANRRELDNLVALKSANKLYITPTDVPTDADPVASQVVAYARLFGVTLDPSVIRPYLTAGVVLFVWLGAMLGPFVAATQLRSEADIEPVTVATQSPPSVANLPDIKPANDDTLAPEPLPPKKAPKLTRATQTALDQIRKSGTVEGTRSSVAQQLRISRGSLDRAVDDLSQAGLIKATSGQRFLSLVAA